MPSFTISLARANHHLQHLHRMPMPIPRAMLPAKVRQLHSGYQDLANRALGSMGPMLDRGLGRGPSPTAPRTPGVPTGDLPQVIHPALNPATPLITVIDHAACAGVIAAVVTGPWVGLCFGAKRVLPVAMSCVAIACGCAVGIHMAPLGVLAQSLQMVSGLLALQTRLLLQGTACLTAFRGQPARGT